MCTLSANLWPETMEPKLATIIVAQVCSGLSETLMRFTQMVASIAISIRGVGRGGERRASCSSAEQLQKCHTYRWRTDRNISAMSSPRTYLEELLLFNGTVLVDVDLRDQLSEFIVRDLLAHLVQRCAQIVDANMAVLVLVKAVEYLGVVLGLLVAEGDGNVPDLTARLVAHALQVPLCSLHLVLR